MAVASSTSTSILGSSTATAWARAAWSSINSGLVWSPSAAASKRLRSSNRQRREGVTNQFACRDSDACQGPRSVPPRPPAGWSRGGPAGRRRSPGAPRESGRACRDARRTQSINRGPAPCHRLSGSPKELWPQNRQCQWTGRRSWRSSTHPPNRRAPEPVGPAAGSAAGPRRPLPRGTRRRRLGVRSRPGKSARATRPVPSREEPPREDGPAPAPHLE